MGIINPAAYKEYMREKKSEVHEVVNFNENMTQEDFDKISAKVSSYFTAEMLAKAKAKAHDERFDRTREELNKFEPVTHWERPPGVPEMRQVPTVDENNDDTDDFNPVSFS